MKQVTQAKLNERAQLVSEWDGGRSVDEILEEFAYLSGKIDRLKKIEKCSDCGEFVFDNSSGLRMNVFGNQSGLDKFFCNTECLGGWMLKNRTDIISKATL